MKTRITSAAWCVAAGIGLLLFTTVTLSADSGHDHGSELHPHACEILYPAGVRGAYDSDLWPSGVVPYEFNSNVNSTNRVRARIAMNILEETAGVIFVPRNGEPDCIQIMASTGNSSFVGMIGGIQVVNIASWTETYVIIHELMHALGRWHQQSRPDRNNYIQVNWDCIDVNYQYNYSIAGGASMYGEYDFESVMHYGQYYFSTGCPTMTCLPGYEQWQHVMGQRTHLSSGDVETLSYIYPGGEPDSAVLLVIPSETEMDPGDELDVFGVVRNIGDWVNPGVSAHVYLSEDEVIDSTDLSLGSEYISYILPQEFVNPDVHVTIPPGTPEGQWYIGIHITSLLDQNSENDWSSVPILVGDAEAPCPGDLDADGTVGVNDLLAVIADWGTCPGCDGDLDGNGQVDVNDLLTVIAGWGTCP